MNAFSPRYLHRAEAMVLDYLSNGRQRSTTAIVGQIPRYRGVVLSALRSLEASGEIVSYVGPSGAIWWQLPEVDRG